MIILDKANMLLYIEPVNPPDHQPLRDELSQRMVAAWRRRVSPLSGFRGVHSCACGAQSDNMDHVVHGADGQAFTTNSLCVHYLMFHRAEVPDSELEKVRLLPPSS